MSIQEKPSLQKTILKQNIVYVMTISLLLISITATMTGYFLYRSYRETNIEEIKQTAELVQSIFWEQAHHLEYFTKELDRNRDHNLNREMEFFISFHPTYHTIWLTDANGIVTNTATSTIEMLGFDQSSTEAFKHATDSGFFFSSVYMSPTLRRPVLTISTQYKNGVIALEYPIEQLNIELEVVTKNLGMALTVTDKRATWLVHPEKEMIVQRETDSDFKFVREEFVDNTLSYIRDFDGKKTLTNSLLTSDSSWVISVHQPLSSLVIPVLQLIVTVFLISLVLTLALILLLKNIVESSFVQLRDLMKLSVQLGEGDYYYSSSPASYDEIEQLRMSLIAMSEKVQLREQEQQKLWEQLIQSQKMEAVGVLAGGVAHDFNNILTAIGGFSELLLHEIPKHSSQEESVTEIIKSVKRASALTRQLLAFSRKEQIRLETVNVSVLIFDMMKMLNRIVGEDIALVLNIPEEPIVISADPHQLEQILLNLTVNAADALRSDNCSSPSITIGLSRDTSETYALLSIKDNGPGVSEENKQKIFEPFFTTKGVGKGSGMGLSMVFGIVEQNGAEIELLSDERQKGAEFIVKWKLLEIDESNSETQTVSVNQKITPKKVLFVDDEVSLLSVGKALLSRLGHSVTTAANGILALDELEKAKGEFDLLITDVIMPELPGDKLGKIVQEDYPDIKVVYTSGYTDDRLNNLGIKTTDSNFIAKPFQISDLEDIICTIFSDKFHSDQ